VIGQTISHYRILAKLGEGGMGVVYRARDLTLGREIALKFLPADAAAAPRARKRLLKEAQAASHLNHPSIATIYEMNESEGSPFIAMELVTGATLNKSSSMVPWKFDSFQTSRGKSLKACERLIAPAFVTATSSPPTSCSMQGLT
jgi:serine/threonine protein kinase